MVDQTRYLGTSQGLRLGITEVPVMTAKGWTEAQKRAYTIDNRLTENSRCHQPTFDAIAGVAPNVL